MQINASPRRVLRREVLISATVGTLGYLIGRRVEGFDAQLVKTAVNRGVRWLLRQQASDGGWHSETYGNMRDGAGNTALILAAWSQIPAEQHAETREAYERGIRFLTTNLDTAGLARPRTGIADYPVFATALLLTALKQRPAAVVPDVIARMCRGLAFAQRSSATGWSEEHPDFGGWGLTVDRDVDKDPASPSNLSSTAAALTALKSHAALRPEAVRDVLKFLTRCQNTESDGADAGGFAFTVRPEDSLNKAGWRRTKSGVVRPIPYPSATCDGVIALWASGVALDGDQLAAAITWLVNSSSPETDGNRGFREWLVFYEAQAWAKVCRLTRHPQLLLAHRRHVERLLSCQRSDGSWSNAFFEMREDDPLIATACALLALTEISAPTSEK